MFSFRVRFPASSSADGDFGAVWQRLRRAFPWTVSAVVGPGEVQLLSHVASPQSASGRLAGLLRGSGRDVSVSDIRTVGVAADRWAELDAALLTLPARRGWVDDPLAWAWSTARDVAGAVADPWVTDRWSRRLLRPLRPPDLLREVEASIVTDRPLPPSLAWRAAAAALRVDAWAARGDAAAQRLCAALQQSATERGAMAVPQAWIRAGQLVASHPQLLRFVSGAVRSAGTRCDALVPARNGPPGRLVGGARASASREPHSRSTGASRSSGASRAPGACGRARRRPAP